MAQTAQVAGGPARVSLARRVLGSIKKRWSKRKPKTWRERIVGWFTGARFFALMLMLALFVVRTVDPQITESLRLRTFDMYQRISPRTTVPEPPNTGVIIVDIDERALREYGQWPWPRTLLADLVNNLMQYGALVIGFDAFFPEPDRMSPSLFAETYAGLPPEIAAQLKTMPTNDAVFADMLRRSRVVLGQTAVSGEGARELPKFASGAFRGPPGGIPAILCPQPYKNPALPGGCDGEAWAKSRLPHFDAVAANVKILEDAAAGHGMVTVEPDPDGIVRRVPAIFLVQNQMYPALTIDMLRLGLQRQSYLVAYDVDGVNNIGITPQFRVPVDTEGRIYVNYRRPDPEMFVSAADVLSATAPVEKLQNKFVLVGTSAAGLKDIRATPMSSTAAGVEVHANILETVLTNTYLNRTGVAEVYEKIAALVAGSLMILLVPLVGAGATLVLLMALIGGLVGYSWYQYTDHLTLIDTTYPGLSVFALYLLLTFTGYVKTQGEKKQVRGAFAQYLSPALVEQLAADPDKLKLGGEMKNMTFLFCDVRGFTSISEQFKANPQGLTHLINKFLTPMTDIILARQGTIDKYMGDCIMAFWNAPLDDDKHQQHACESALSMFERLGPLNEELKKEAEAEKRKFFPINVGVGLNSGEVVVGNMGSNQRFDYSVLGDAVNLAARLEGQSKAYHVGVVIGETTERAARGEYATLELDLIAVKGKAEAVRIFTLAGRKDKADSAEFKAHQAKHSEMLAAYRAQQWDRAEALIAELRTMDKSDMGGFYDLYNERIAEYRAAPPAKDWDGVFRATSK